MDVEQVLIGAIIFGLLLVAGGLLWQRFTPKRPAQKTSEASR